MTFIPGHGRRRALVGRTALQRQVVVPLKYGRTLIAAVSLARRPSRQWAVFLPESNSDFRFGDRSELVSLVGPQVAKELNYLVINKPGQRPDGSDRGEFERSFCRDRRIEDYVTVLKTLVPRGDRVHLIGYSEGAYLAPQVGRLDSRVRSVTMIGGGTRGWLKEELSNASPTERPEYERKIREIYSNPTSKRRWNGFSYATWYSYRGDNTLRALRELDVPTLAILGARDRVIDLKSTIVDLMLVSEDKPIQVHLFGDCGHQFSRHWGQVSRVLGRFLADQLGLTGTRRRQ